MVSSNTFTILSAVTCILALTSVGLTASHSVSHSSVKYKSSGLVVKTMGNIDHCPSAAQIKTENDSIEMVVSCPYRPATKAIALISLISLQILLILLCCKLRDKVKSMIIVIFAIIEFPLLFVSGILMIADMISGRKQLSGMSNYSYQPAEYIINILFVFFGMICGMAATCYSFPNRPPTHPTQVGNASMAATEPHWAEGESRAQSADFIKPYRDYQGGSSSSVYLPSNNRNASPSPYGRSDQAYLPQNNQYRRNPSYEEDYQSRSRQGGNMNNFNYGGYQQGTNGNGRSYGNPSQRAMNLTIETNNTNQINYNNYNNSNQNYSNHYAHYPNNSRAGQQNRGNRNNYPGSNQSQIYTNNNNDSISYERDLESNREILSNNHNNNNHGTISYGRSAGNHSKGGQNKFSSALNRIGAMRGGVHAFENGSNNNKGYLNYANGPNHQEDLDYYRPENRGRARSTDQNNYEEGDYQRAGQRNASQDNENYTPYNYGMDRPAPSQNYGAY